MAMPCYKKIWKTFGLNKKCFSSPYLLCILLKIVQKVPIDLNTLLVWADPAHDKDIAGEVQSSPSFCQCWETQRGLETCQEIGDTGWHLNNHFRWLGFEQSLQPPQIVFAPAEHWIKFWKGTPTYQSTEINLLSEDWFIMNLKYKRFSSKLMFIWIKLTTSVKHEWLSDYEPLILCFKNLQM